MKIKEIVNEGLLDALKFVGRAAYKAAGGAVDKDDPTVSRANLEYVRKQLGPEIYKKFVNELIRLGIVKGNQLQDPNKIGDINEMAVQFLKQAYSAYIVTPDRMFQLTKRIESEFPYITNPTRYSPVPLEQLQGKFLEINAFYLEMLKDVESTTSANVITIIDQLSKGINANIPVPVRAIIKRFLNDMATKSLASLEYPFSNSSNPTIAAAIGTMTSDEIKLYDETIKAIINLKDQGKLNVDMIKYFASQVR